MSQLSISPTSVQQAIDVDAIANGGNKALPTGNVLTTADGTSYFYSKRLLDILFVLLGLPLLVPVMLLIALLIKLDSPGPIFFRQKRVGARRISRHGNSTWEIQSFEIFKFRSMYVDADESVHQEHVRAWISGELDDNVDSHAKNKLQNDPRITRVGRYIRKTSLDEIPQLINVLLGQMSLVGPRPVPEYEVAQYQPEHYQRLYTLPGLTGLWQVTGRGNVSFEEMMDLDLRYVQTQSLWKDIQIIMMTIPAVLLGWGAE